MSMNKSYSEMMQYETFEERYKYLRLGGAVGKETFGFDRWINQNFYRSVEWKQVRSFVIVRDNGYDLAHPDHPINGAVLVHHINPMSVEDVQYSSDVILDPDNLVAVTHATHNAIHYGDASLLPEPYKPRVSGDTNLWQVFDMGITLITPNTKGADHIGFTAPVSVWYKENNIDFSLRYCVPRSLAQWNKDIKGPEIAWHAANKKALGLNWEHEAEEPLKGASYGSRAGRWLYRMAIELRVPIETALWISVDLLVDESNTDICEEFVRAFHAEIGNYRLGVYGGNVIIDRVSDLNPIGWKAAASSWSKPEVNEDHVYIHQFPQLSDVDVDPNICVKPFYMWVPDKEHVWPKEFPLGYNREFAPWAEQDRRTKGYLCHPTTLDYNENIIRARDGLIGFGSGYRSREGDQPSEASRTGRSFHFIHKYADGRVFFTAFDFVAADPNGGNHVVPPAGLIPRQEDPEVSDWHVMLNVGTLSGGTSSYYVHVQPEGQDGFDSWEAAGRPSPSDIYDPTEDFRIYEPDPIPGFIPVEELDKDDEMNDVAIVRIPVVGAWLYPSLTPVTQELIPFLTETLELPMISCDDDGSWALMSVILHRMEPAMANAMRERYNAATQNIDIPELVTPLPEISVPPAVVNVELPGEMRTSIVNWPEVVKTLISTK